MKLPTSSPHFVNKSMKIRTAIKSGPGGAGGTIDGYPIQTPAPGITVKPVGTWLLTWPRP